MYPAGVEAILILGLFIWSGILSFLLWREYNFLYKLFPKSEGFDIRVKLKEITEVLEESARREQIVNKNIRDLVKSNLSHTQKVVLLRYNPYTDMGGNVSFSLALLDGKGDGLILSSLHTRSGTRVYAKEINKGKSDLELSEEEAEVLLKALND